MAFLKQQLINIRGMQNAVIRCNKIRIGIGQFFGMATTPSPLLRLNKASVYQSYNAMQDRDAYRALRQYKSEIKWDSHHKIIDIGCGPGNLTANRLLPLIPPSGKMVGVDISHPMIQYAKSTYKDDPRLSFEVMDITNSETIKKYHDTFNSVFSFYCLHWVQDQWTTMKNIYDILQNNGEILLVFLADSPIYALYKKLATNEKWAPYMKDYRDVISPYHDCADPETEIRNLLSEIGFKVVDCTCKPTTYSMPSREVLYKSIQAVNPFLNRIPESLQEQYARDCEKEIHNSRLCSVSEKTGKVTFTYSLITVYATKFC